MDKAITNKKELFPKWNPIGSTIIKMSSGSWRVRLTAIRNSSGGFAGRKDVRNYIFKRDGFKCLLCGSKDYLQIDHIKSVYLASKDEDILNILNTKENLRTLCRSCNCGLTPNG